MAQVHVDGNLYNINFRNSDQSFNITITITGNTYSAETIWSLAQCLLPCVKQIWFDQNDTVTVSTIEVVGNGSEIANPDA